MQVIHLEFGDMLLKNNIHSLGLSYSYFVFVKKLKNNNKNTETKSGLSFVLGV
jgi:hypothetical protein